MKFWIYYQLYYCKPIQFYILLMQLSTPSCGYIVYTSKYSFSNTIYVCRCNPAQSETIRSSQLAGLCAINAFPHTLVSTLYFYASVH